jgi:hypothetical protein
VFPNFWWVLYGDTKMQMLFYFQTITDTVAQWVKSWCPTTKSYKSCILGSTPGKTILLKYSKIASGLSRIYNTASIPVKFFPFKLRALFYHQYHLPLYQIQLMWHSGYGPCATKFPINSLWVQYWVKSFYQIIQRLPQGCP